MPPCVPVAVGMPVAVMLSSVMISLIAVCVFFTLEIIYSQ